MAQFYGADVEQLTQLGRELSTSARELEAVVARLGSRINEVAWYGPDAQRFVADWNSRLSRDLRAVASGLDDSASAATRNAREQEQVSSGGDTGGGSWSDVLPTFPFPDAAIGRPAVEPDQFDFNSGRHVD